MSCGTSHSTRAQGRIASNKYVLYPKKNLNASHDSLLSFIPLYYFLTKTDVKNCEKNFSNERRSETDYMLLSFSIFFVFISLP